MSPCLFSSDLSGPCLIPSDLYPYDLCAVLCPDGWVHVDGNVCMWKSSVPLSWDDALASCQWNLSHLLILHDEYYFWNGANPSRIFNDIKNLALGPPGILPLICVITIMWCRPNVNLRKLLSAPKSHVRVTSLFTSAIPNQIRNRQTSRFVSFRCPVKIREGQAEETAWL